MKPFNLERALAGDPVVTRDGRVVTELHLFKDRDLAFPLRGVLKFSQSDNADEKYLGGFTLEGRYVNESKSNSDLFMAPKELKLWINLYKSTLTLSGYDAQMPYTSKEAADRGANRGDSFIKTIEVTVEE